jgi:hypothetical protein
MSLLVQAYTYDSQGEMQMLAPKDPADSMAGVEGCRWSLYASSCAKRHGLRLLPQLEIDGLCAEGNDLTQLGTEAQDLLQHAEEYATESGLRSRYIVARAKNILKAIGQAKAIGGGVYIG